MKCDEWRTADPSMNVYINALVMVTRTANYITLDNGTENQSLLGDVCACINQTMLKMA